MRFSKKDECLSFQKAHYLDHGMENIFIQGVDNDVYAHVTQRHAAIVIQTGNIEVEDNDGWDDEDDMEEDVMGKEHEDLFDDVEDCCSCHKSKKAEEMFYSCSVCLNIHCHVCNNMGKIELPVHCCGCDTFACDGCAPMCQHCHESACSDCYYPHVCSD
jgi:hypothetical protein